MRVRIDGEAFAASLRRALATNTPPTAPAADPWLTRLIDAGTAALEDDAARGDFSVHNPLPH